MYSEIYGRGPNNREKQEEAAETTAVICSMYAQDMHPRSIAESLGFSLVAVYRHLSRGGVKLCDPRLVATSKRAERAKALRSELGSVEKVAEAMGASRRTVYALLARH